VQGNVNSAGKEVVFGATRSCACRSGSGAAARASASASFWALTTFAGSSKSTVQVSCLGQRPFAADNKQHDRKDGALFCSLLLSPRDRCARWSALSPLVRP
jgi:hypothetical protein